MIVTRYIQDYATLWYESSMFRPPRLHISYSGGVSRKRLSYRAMLATERGRSKHIVKKVTRIEKVYRRRK